MNVTSVLDPFMLQLKIALYVGLVVAAPIWLYQLWAFIAPGLHKRERKYSYTFAAVATPLFAAGFALGYVLVSRSMRYFLGVSGNLTITVDLEGYFSFVTGVMLLFGAAFEFPLIVAMLNFAGLVSARRLLDWWRPAIFLMFLFAALVTPDPGPVQHDDPGRLHGGALLRRGRGGLPQRPSTRPSGPLRRGRRRRGVDHRAGVAGGLVGVGFVALRRRHPVRPL